MDKDKTKKKPLKKLADVAKNVSNHTAEIVKRNGEEETSMGSQSDLEKRLNQFLALQRAYTTIHSTMASKDILQKVAEAAVNILGYDHSFVIAFDEDKNRPSETAFFQQSRPGTGKRCGNIRETNSESCPNTGKGRAIGC